MDTKSTWVLHIFKDQMAAEYVVAGKKKYKSTTYRTEDFSAQLLTAFGVNVSGDFDINPPTEL